MFFFLRNWSCHCIKCNYITYRVKCSIPLSKAFFLLQDFWFYDPKQILSCSCFTLPVSLLQCHRFMTFQRAAADVTLPVPWRRVIGRAGSVAVQTDAAGLHSHEDSAAASAQDPAGGNVPPLQLIHEAYFCRFRRYVYISKAGWAFLFQTQLDLYLIQDIKCFTRNITFTGVRLLKQVKSDWMIQYICTKLYWCVIGS